MTRSRMICLYLDEYIKTSPQEAVLSMYNSLAKTGESVVRGFKGVKLDEGNYLKAAKRLMKRYQIKQSLNPGIDSEIAQRIKEFVTEVNDNPNANYNEALNVLANDCKSFLLMSGDYDDTGKEIREQILGEIRGSTILLRPYEESQILESFGGMKNLKRAFFGKVNVGYERNKKKGGTYWYIEELVKLTLMRARRTALRAGHGLTICLTMCCSLRLLTLILTVK